MPLKLVKLDWASAHIAGELARIALEERVGVAVEVDLVGSTTQAWRKLADCSNANSGVERCVFGPRGSMGHVVFEAWSTLYSGMYWNEGPDVGAERLPILAGDMGYRGIQGMFLPGETVEAAWRDGVPLDHYRMYSTSAEHVSIADYFVRAEDIGDGTSCENGFIEHRGAPNYFRVSGDWQAVDLGERNHSDRYRCSANSTLLTKPCRDQGGLSCLPVVTAKGWGTENFMQWAFFHSMPLEIFSFSVAEYEVHVQHFSTLFYWWLPDTTFSGMAPVEVMFPEENLDEHVQGVLAAASHSIRLSILTNSAVRDPSVAHFVEQFGISQQDMQSLVDQHDRHDDHEQARQLACGWLRAHPETVRSWALNRRYCGQGQGIVRANGTWVLAAFDIHTEMEEPTSCRLCEPGWRSILNMDHVVGDHHHADDYRCERCPVGTYQHWSGQTDCRRCDAGTIAEEPGSVVCSRCPRGTFQEGSAASGCRSCETVLPGSNTEHMGATSSSMCVCSPGTAVARASGDAGQPFCRRCSTGLLCPGGLGPPMQDAGYATSAPAYSGAWPTSVVRCASAAKCPARLALGTCSGRRQGIACDMCPIGWVDRLDGACEECKGVVAAFPLVGCLLAMLVAAGAVLRVCTQESPSVRLTVVSLTIAFMLGVNSLQALSTFAYIRLAWVEPMRSLRTITDLFVFDVDLVNPSCVFGTSSPTVKLLLALLGYPIFALMLMVGFKLMRRCSGLNKNYVFSSLGFTMSLMFLTLCNAVLQPWRCEDNPDGTSSMAFEKSVQCWTEEHKPLVALSVLGILFYLVGFLAIVSWATLLYKHNISNVGGVEFLRRYYFLFGRFSDECYHYGLIYIFRSLLIALVPVLFSKLAIVQIWMLALIIFVGGAIQVHLCPWRTAAANVLDAAFSVGLLLALLVGACLVDREDVAGHTMNLLLHGVSAVIASVFGGYVLYIVHVTWARPRRYSIFLCHHKADAGVLARWLKLELKDQIIGRVFLDADEGDSMDRTADIVMNSTNNLVVLLTKLTLLRTSCATEIACAVYSKRKTNIVLVGCNGFEGISQELIANLDDAWTLTQVLLIEALGLKLELVKNAYCTISSLPILELDQTAHQVAQLSCLDEVITNCTNIKRQNVRAMIRKLTNSTRVQGKVAIMGDNRNPEAISLQLVLRRLIQSKLQVDIIVADALTRFNFGILYIVVVLTQGVLENALFAVSLVNALDTGSLEVVPVLASTSFSFPDSSFWGRLLRGNLLNEEELIAHRGDRRRIAEAYQALFNILSLHFSPHASLKIQEAQVEEMAVRFRALSSDGPFVPTKLRHGSGDELMGLFAMGSRLDSCFSRLSQSGSSVEGGRSLAQRLTAALSAPLVSPSILPPEARVDDGSPYLLDASTSNPTNVSLPTLGSTASQMPSELHAAKSDESMAKREEESSRHSQSPRMGRCRSDGSESQSPSNRVVGLASDGGVVGLTSDGGRSNGGGRSYGLASYLPPDDDSLIGERPSMMKSVSFVCENDENSEYGDTRSL